MSPASTTTTPLDATRRAFDAVAADYDGPLGNNDLIRRMRALLLEAVLAAVPPGAHLLDLGCGTGLDAVALAARGHRVLAVDWSPAMIERTRARAADAGLADRVRAEVLGIHELDRLAGERFDVLYSDLGPLNCVPDLSAVAPACAALLAPGGRLVASVIGRHCPWELAYYTLRGDPARARLRHHPGLVPVPLRGETIWTRYYTPRELAAAFAPHLALVGYRALAWALPPPYMLGPYRRLGPLALLLALVDDRLGALPLARELGDHFLIQLARRAPA